MLRRLNVLCLIALTSAFSLHARADSDGFAYQCFVADGPEKTSTTCRVAGAICGSRPGNPHCKGNTIHVECPDEDFLHAFNARQQMYNGNLILSGPGEGSDKRQAELAVLSYTDRSGGYDAAFRIHRTDNSFRNFNGSCYLSPIADGIR